MREQVLKVVVFVAGLIFLAGGYPLVAFFTKEPAVAMLMSLYVTMGVFLVLAARNPAAHRSLIAFAGWANVAHAGVMAVQYYLHVIEQQEIMGVVLFGIVGIVLIVLAPGKPVRELAAASGD